MSDARPLISVAMAARNSERHIAAALRSVAASLAPNEEDCEIVMADGRSSDATLEIAKSFPAIRLASTSDASLYDGMNRAIAAARGEFIIILNSDDELLPEALGHAVELLRRNPRAGFVSGGVLSGESCEGAKVRNNRRALCQEGLLFGIPAINARVFRTSIVRTVGLIRTDIGLGADREFLLRLLRSGATGLNLDVPLYFYRNHTGSATMSGDRDGRLRVYRSDIELARGLAGSGLDAKLLAAFTALAKLKMRRAGAPARLPGLENDRTKLSDIARGIFLNRKWRGQLSGY